MPSEDRPTPTQLSAVQTHRLLGLASLPDDQDQNWLIEAGDRDLLAMLLGDMCGESGPSGTALIQAVCAPDASVEDLRKVKDLAKKLAMDARDQRHRGAAGLLYHLAMASAFGYHEVNLSSIGAPPPAHLYRELIEGISEDSLVAVFEKAVERLPEGSEQS
jgi:hypothetical protein